MAPTAPRQTIAKGPTETPEASWASGWMIARPSMPDHGRFLLKWDATSENADPATSEDAGSADAVLEPSADELASDPETAEPDLEGPETTPHPEATA